MLTHEGETMIKATRVPVPGRRLAALPVISAVIALALIAAAPTAFAVTKVHLGQNRENYLCSPSDQWIQTASSGPSYVVPAGVTKLTRWSTSGGKDAGTMQFEVWSPAGGNNYKLVYISAPTTLQAHTVTKVTLKPAVKVVAGDVLGYRAVTPADCAFRTNSSADVYLYGASTTSPTVGSTVGFQGPASGFRFNVAAVAP